MTNLNLSLQTEKQQVVSSLRVPLIAVLVLWAVKLFELITHTSLSSWGIYPRTLHGLFGVITAPLIHGQARADDWLGNFSHLFSNTMPLIVLGFLVLLSYRQIAAHLLTIIWLGSGILVWIFGRPSYHIGASMIIYGLAFFVFFSGVFRKDVRSIALASIVVLFYGSMIWGLLPIERGVSWEGHLAGALTGIACAHYYRHINPRKRYDWEIEEEQLAQTQSDNSQPEDPFWATKPPPPSTSNILDWEVKYHYIDGKKKE